MALQRLLAGRYPRRKAADRDLPDCAVEIHLLDLARQIFGAGGAIIQKKNKEKEKGKGKEERREKRKKERGEFNLEDPMFLFNFHSFFQKIIK